MNKIKEIIIGTNNEGKYREICDLLPKDIKKHSPKEFNILSPAETGKSFEENSFIKASYFSKKTNLICLSDDSGLAIKKIFEKMSNVKKDWENNNSAKFICCMTLFRPNGKNYCSQGTIKGKISKDKKGKNGFGYDPIFIPNGYNQTFGEMEFKLKMSIDHRFKAFDKIRKFFI